VQKEGQNQGRQFWSCPKSGQDERCDFFEWADDNGGGSGGNKPSGVTPTFGGGGGQSGGCFKVRIPDTA